MDNFSVFPLFSQVVYATQIEVDTDQIIDSIKGFQFRGTGHDDSHQSYSTENLNILDSIPHLKTVILDSFVVFKNEILKLENTDFKITTSWATKTLINGYSQYHCHRNSYYSGVMYFDNCLGGDLEFENVGINQSQFLLNDPSEWNIYNYEKFSLCPEKNMIVFFPSMLRHRINSYKDSKERYSLAFNFFPVGKLGSGDSTIQISHGC